MNIEKKLFGNVDGRDVDIYTLTVDSGMSAEIITYGGAIRRLMVPDRRGELCDIVGSKVGASFGVTLSEFEWTYVKIVCHLSKNTKDVYLNGLLYAEGLPLSASDSTAFITAKTRIMQYKSSGIGTVYFDDYKFYN